MAQFVGKPVAWYAASNCLAAVEAGAGEMAVGSGEAQGEAGAPLSRRRPRPRTLLPSEERKEAAREGGPGPALCWARARESGNYGIYT